jgi:hypothetical protein
MKTTRRTFTPGRHEQRMDPGRDSYRDDAKLPDPAACTRCGAAYLAGRWTWRDPPEGAATLTCPACRRIEQRQPAGILTLAGPFLAAHLQEIVQLVAGREAREREEHPMQRIIGIEQSGESIEITTTDAHLARGLAVAVQDAFKGELDIEFAKDENFVRAAWRR